MVVRIRVAGEAAGEGVSLMLPALLAVRKADDSVDGLPARVDEGAEREELPFDDPCPECALGGARKCVDFDDGMAFGGDCSGVAVTAVYAFVRDRVCREERRDGLPELEFERPIR